MKIYPFSIILMFLLFVSPEDSWSKKQALDIRQIVSDSDWGNKELNRRMLAISSLEFVDHWKARDVYNNFFVIGDYFLYDGFMPHYGGNKSYLCYNPKIDKLSVAYREIVWNSVAEKGIIHLASEEPIFPMEICKVGFGKDFYNDSLVMANEQSNHKYNSDVQSKSVADYILSNNYSKALKELERQYDSTCILKINVWDSINRQSFVGFRDYLIAHKGSKVYAPLMHQCIKKSIQIFDDVDALNMGAWFPKCDLKFKDGVPSMEYAINAYLSLNEEHQYDSCLAKCYYEIAIYQLNYIDYLDINARRQIKEYFWQAYKYYTQLHDAKSVLALYWLGFEYKQEKDYENAIKYFELALELAQGYYGIDGEEYVIVLDQLRDAYYASYRYDKAAKAAQLYVSCVNRLDKSPSVHVFRMRTCNYAHQLSSIHSDMQAAQEYTIFSNCRINTVRQRKFSEIEEYYTNREDWNKVVPLREKLLENETHIYWIPDRLNSLASAYHHIGDLDSEEYCKVIWVDGVKEKYGDKSEEYAVALLDLCKTYQSQANDDKAFKCADQAIRIEYGCEKHDKMLDVLKGCGEYSIWSGKWGNAEFCFKQIIKISEDMWGMGYLNETRAKDLEPLVNVYLLMGDTSQAANVVYEIMDLGKQPDGKEIFNYKFLGEFAERVNDDTLAITFYYTGGLFDEVERILYRNKEFNDAKYFINHHFDSVKNIINQRIVYERESERDIIWNKNNYYLTQTIPQYCYEAYLDSVDYSDLAYDDMLFMKGFLLTTSQTINNIIMSSQDEDQKMKWRELLVIQDVLSQPLRSDSVAILKERARYIEQQILFANRDILSQKQKQSITWNDVQKALNRKKIAIEFMSVPMSMDSIIYCALMLQKSSKIPQLIPLFEEKEVLSHVNTTADNLTNKTYSYEENGEQLSQLVWSKILPYIKQGETIYFAPSGILHQLAIEALPYDESHTMGDMFNLVRLSSTREIVTRKDEFRQSSTATLYGGIQYNMDADELLTESEAYKTTDLLASRGIECDTLNRGAITYLKGTKSEAENINALLKQNNLQVQLFTAKNANEESFKVLSGKHRNILHIATHGFYWSDSTAQKKDYFSQRVMRMGDDISTPPSIDPLNRCGLLFAGAQTAWSGHSAELPEGVQDGILTAKEISLLDLRDADLVVLSACETGKGEITGDGVFGLQRAFKQAGAQTIVMSLWPVNDAATQLLMTEFYRNWITNHQSKREAFRNAQNTVRSQYEEPVYWAGFIMLD